MPVVKCANKNDYQFSLTSEYCLKLGMRLTFGYFQMLPLISCILMNTLWELDLDKHYANKVTERILIAPNFLGSLAFN